MSIIGMVNDLIRKQVWNDPAFSADVRELCREVLDATDSISERKAIERLDKYLR